MVFIIMRVVVSVNEKRGLVRDQCTIFDLYNSLVAGNVDGKPSKADLQM